MKSKSAIVLILVMLVVGSAGVAFYLWKSGNFPYFDTQKVPTLAQGTATNDLTPSSDGTIPAGPRVSATLVRKLGNVQDRIIRGDREAISQQHQAITEINESLKELPLEIWRNRFNVQSLLLYVLCGGNSNVLKTVILSEVLQADEKELAEGVYFFNDGQRDKALDRLEKIDPRSLGRSLTGPVALALASLLEEKDAKRALALLDEARLQSPHTALEEASIRRQILLLVKQTDLAQALPLAALYFRRYGASLYAEALQESFAVQLAAQVQTPNATWSEELLSEFESLDPNRRSELLSAIARQSLHSGNLNLAKSAAKAILSMEPQQSIIRKRATLYAAAADAPSSEAAAALVLLGSLSNEQLTVEEIQLRDAAIRIARNVMGKDVQSGAGGSVIIESQKPSEPYPASSGNEPALRAVISKADNVMKRADELEIGGN